jgi:hypothetical protein
LTKNILKNVDKLSVLTYKVWLAAMQDKWQQSKFLTEASPTIDSLLLKNRNLVEQNQARVPDTCSSRPPGQIANQKFR